MRRWYAVLAAVVAIVSGHAAAVSAAPADTVLAWVARPTCAAPTSGTAACLAQALVRERVSKTQLGALPHHGQRVAIPAFSRGPAGGYSPATLASAYGVNPDAAVAGSQVVAIVDACVDPKIANDLNMFDSTYQLPAESDATFRELPTGTGSCTNADAMGWATETSLDVEAVRGLCHLCKILLVEAATSKESELAHAEDVAAAYSWLDNGAILTLTAISNSYGSVETSSDVPSDYAKHYYHPGIAVIASDGDDGWYGWDNINTQHVSDGAPPVPAAFATVVAAGGTTLSVHTDGTRGSEQVWNRNGSFDATGSQAHEALGATGGGCSVLHAAPRYQKYVSNYASLGCLPGMRSATDIAADGDPYTGYDVYNSDVGVLDPKWRTFGGTSLASPLIAAMWALAGGTGGLTYPALSLYGHYKSGFSALYDVTHGGNAFCGGGSLSTCESQWGQNPNTFGAGAVDCGFNWGTHVVTGIYQCRARAGYDGPSGIGTPAALALFRPMAPKAVITLPTGARHGVLLTLGGAHSTDPFPGGVLETYHWNFGDGSSGTGSSASVRHIYAKSGTYTVALTVTDNYGQKSVVATAALRVA